MLAAPVRTSSGGDAASSTTPARLSANSGYAQCCPREPAIAGAANFGGVAGNTSREYLIDGQNGTTENWEMSRIRQTGTIAQIKVYLANLTNLTAFYYKVWRRNTAGTFDLVGTSENILSSLVAGSINTVTLSSPITGVCEGDAYGFRTEWSDGAQNLYSKAPTVPSNFGPASVFTVINTTPSTSAYNWYAQTETLNTIVPIAAYMTPPIFVSFTDSMLRVYNNTPSNSIPHWVGTLLNYPYQNFSIGGESLALRAARVADMVALKPRFALLQGGTAAFSTTTVANTLTHWTTILDACVAADIIPVVYLIFPMSPSTSDADNVSRELKNVTLTNLIFRNYPTAIIIDTESTVGMNRVAGSVDGNFWDIRTAYRTAAADVHFNAIGKRIVAELTVERINAHWARFT